MATKTVPGTADRNTIPFGLEATALTVAPGASLTDLADDCNCLFGAGLAALESMSDAVMQPGVPADVSEPWWAMLYTLRQAKGVFDAMYSGTHAAGQRQEGGAA